MNIVSVGRAPRWAPDVSKEFVAVASDWLQCRILEKLSD